MERWRGSRSGTPNRKETFTMFVQGETVNNQKSLLRPQWNKGRVWSVTLPVAGWVVLSAWRHWLRTMEAWHSSLAFPGGQWVYLKAVWWVMLVSIFCVLAVWQTCKETAAVVRNADTPFCSLLRWRKKNPDLMQSAYPNKIDISKRTSNETLESRIILISLHTLSKSLCAGVDFRILFVIPWFLSFSFSLSDLIFAAVFSRLLHVVRERLTKYDGMAYS